MRLGVVVCLLVVLFTAVGAGMKLSEEGADGSEYESTDFSPYSEYFSVEPPSTIGEVESYSPSQVPSELYIGGRAVTFTGYQTTYGQSNALWIEGTSSWTQAVLIPQGAYLSLLAYAPSGGSADFYEVYPDKTLDHNRYGFVPGYNRITFHADAIGRHVLFFVIRNQPSNLVIVDVRSGSWPPSPGPGPAPGPSPGPVSGYATIVFSSSWLKGYSVFVDGTYVGADGQAGDPLDGVYTLTVPGNQYHVLSISGGGQTYSERGTFLSGVRYTLRI